MTIEERVDKLEKKFEELEKSLNDSLTSIKEDLVEIKSCVKNIDSIGDLKNESIKKDIKSNSIRIKKLEDIVSKLTWTIILAVVGIVGEAIYYFIQIGG